MHAPEIVAFRGVGKTFPQPDNRFGTVNNINLSLRSGECLSLLGINGSGKSTLLRMACGLVTPDEGEISIFGGNPAADGCVRARIASMFEGGRALYARLTPVENVTYFACVKGADPSLAKRRFDEMCQRFSIEHYSKIVVQKLSKGTQQKFSLLCALASGTELWMLDEPTLGMDADSVIVLVDIIREHLQSDGALLMATHDELLARSLGDVRKMDEFKEAA